MSVASLGITLTVLLSYSWYVWYQTDERGMAVAPLAFKEQEQIIPSYEQVQQLREAIVYAQQIQRQHEHLILLLEVMPATISDQICLEQIHWAVDTLTVQGRARVAAALMEWQDCLRDAISCITVSIHHIHRAIMSQDSLKDNDEMLDFCFSININ